MRGVVQGVGFRPHVFGLATKLGLSGFVLNDGARQAATDSVGERFQMGGDATLGGVEGQPTGGGDQVTTPAEDEEAHPYGQDEMSEPEPQKERGEPGSRDKGGPPGSGPVERPAEPVHDATEYSGVGPQDRIDKDKMPPMPPGDQGG